MFTVGPPPAQGWTDAMGGYHPYNLDGLGRCVPCGDPALRGLAAAANGTAQAPAFSERYVQREQQKFGFGGLALGAALGAGIAYFWTR